MRIVTLLVLLLVAPSVLAQDTGDCAVGTAHVILDGSDVRASVYNTGRLFYDARTEADDPPHFEVPKGGGVDAIFSSGLWVGGLLEGDESALRMSATTYSLPELWPGPIPADGTAPSAADCADADRIWQVTLEDVARYNDTGAATTDLADWPVHLGAPVVDGDGVEGNYDLAAGDRPAVLGDETAWWVLNDLGNTHEWSGAPAIGLEVRVTAFTVSEPYARERLFLGRFAADAQHMVFVRHDLVYRGDAPLVGTYAGFHLDPDVGFSGDDHFGSYPEQDLVMAYNGSDVDGFYGASPPASGLRILRGPAESALSGAIDPSLSPSSPIGYFCYEEFGRGEQYYSRFLGLFCDGVPQTTGGDGYNLSSSSFSAYAFPGLPPSYWSQVNTDGSGRRSQPTDVRVLASHGPFDMLPGETYTVETAYLWARSDLGVIPSVNRLAVEAAPTAKAIPFTPDPALATIRLGDLPSALPAVTDPVVLPSANTLAATVRPNPASRTARIAFALASDADVRLDVLDALGRQVARPVDGRTEAGEHAVDLDVSAWPQGLYVYRLTLGGRPAGTGRLVVVR